MAAVAIDTSALLAFVDADDPAHDAATDLVGRIDGGAYPTAHVTDTVLLETLNWIHSRQRHETAVEFYDRLETSAGFDLRQTATRDVTRAVELFRSHDTPSFGDCAIAAYMDRTDLEFVYTFDAEDFAVFEWVTPLDSPVDPFEPG